MSCSIYDNWHLMPSSLSESSTDDFHFEDKQPKKGITFASHAKVVEYKDKHDIDPRSTWYSKSDYKRFRYDRIADAVAMKGKHPDDLCDEKGECFWGLENVLVSALRDRVVQTRTSIIQGVLTEQGCQERQDRCNPHDLARKSMVHSEWSEAVARKKALFYSSEVVKNLQETDFCSGT